MSAMMIQAIDLEVARGGNKVLKGLCFEVAAGEVYALLGGNGAGKSTTLLSCLGFIPPSAGQMHIQGLNPSTHRQQVCSLIAYVPESASLYNHLTAYENLQYFLRLAQRPCDLARLNEALDTMGLAPSARGQRLNQYSKGMRQKVALALALLRDSAILLLDEPTSGLDPMATDEFHRHIRALADRGKTILMVTHDRFGACEVADRVGLLHGGTLLGELQAPPAGRVDAAHIQRLFNPSATT